MLRSRVTLDWETAVGRFRFQYAPQSADEIAALTTPGGETLKLPAGEWRSIAAAIMHALRFGEEPARIAAAASKPANQGKPWTPELDAELRSLWQGGKSVTEIAEQFRRTPGAITSRLIGIGLIDPRGEIPPAAPAESV